MASITLTGTLLDPTGEVAVGDQIRFTHRTTTGDTIKFARSILIIPPSGMYNITLEFGNIFVEYLDIKDVQYKPLGVVTVNQDSTATSLPELLNAIVPPTDEQLLEFQSILADTVAAKDIAVAAAAQQTTLELIASTVTHPAGTVLTLSGYTLSGDGGGAQWKLNGVVGQPVSQSPADLADALLNDGNGNQWALVPLNATASAEVNPKTLGAVGTGGVTDDTGPIDALFGYMESNPSRDGKVVNGARAILLTVDAPVGYFPVGEYNYSGTGYIPIINKAFKIRGDSPSSSTINILTDVHLVNPTDASKVMAYVEFSDIKIVGGRGAFYNEKNDVGNVSHGKRVYNCVIAGYTSVAFGYIGREHV